MNRKTLLGALADPGAGGRRVYGRPLRAPGQRSDHVATDERRDRQASRPLLEEPASASRSDDDDPRWQDDPSKDLAGKVRSSTSGPPGARRAAPRFPISSSCRSNTRISWWSSACSPRTIPALSVAVRGRLQDQLSHRDGDGGAVGGIHGHVCAAHDVLGGTRSESDVEARGADPPGADRARDPGALEASHRCGGRVRADNKEAVLASNARATEIPGLDLASLTPDQRTTALNRLNEEPCGCGCGMSIAHAASTTRRARSARSSRRRSWTR